MAIAQFGMGGFLTWLYADKGILDTPTVLTTTKVAKKPIGTEYSLEFSQTDAESVYIARETIAFFFVTGLFHSIYAATHDGLYRDMMRSQNNYLRWIEYGISATLMMRIIALQAGIRDRDTLSLITTSMIGVMLMGQIVEVSLRESNFNLALVATIIGWILMLGVFAIVIRKFLELQDSVKGFGCKDVEIPKFVIWIIVTQLVFYATFGFIQIYHIWRCWQGGCPRFENIEKLYILDSLLAKLTLGGILAYSVLGADSGVYGTFKC